MAGEEPADRQEQNRREGRGRLSSIDMLPDEAEPDVVWALDQLRDRKLPQNVILAEFNERLADRGIEPVSKSAWSRFAVRKAIQFRKLDEIQRMSGELVTSLGAERPDQVTVAVAEMLKLAMFNLLEKAENTTTKEVMELGRALQATVNAQKASADARRKLQEEVDAQLRKAAAEVEAVGKKNGVSAETLAEINRALGVG
ncbi:phage protein Gp27 family protein [Novosphingobium huizhouense]|uniref:phage protein Gp27 family protein n=1 Tax=Novosphingobium huizhouense TaxID=2866625 RepID=UPI001CD91092|nr:phage protein Gp27 family protein [Novosphingobium huizhouense]